MSGDILLFLYCQDFSKSVSCSIRVGENFPRRSVDSARFPQGENSEKAVHSASASLLFHPFHLRSSLLHPFPVKFPPPPIDPPGSGERRREVGTVWAPFPPSLSCDEGN